MFASACPLAPFFALLNNIIEIRIDAQKYTRQTKRPIPHRARGIGKWFRIFKFIAVLSIITNGLELAMSSRIVPNIIWRLSDGRCQNDTLDGFAASLYSVIETSELNSSHPNLNNLNPNNFTQCL